MDVNMSYLFFSFPFFSFKYNTHNQKTTNFKLTNELISKKCISVKLFPTDRAGPVRLQPFFNALGMKLMRTLLNANFPITIQTDRTFDILIFAHVGIAYFMDFTSIPEPII